VAIEALFAGVDCSKHEEWINQNGDNPVLIDLVQNPHTQNTAHGAPGASEGYYGGPYQVPGDVDK